MILSYRSVHFISQSYYHITQNPVIHVQTAFPDNASGIDPQLISLLDMIVQKGSQKIVCRGNGMKISCKM